MSTWSAASSSGRAGDHPATGELVGDKYRIEEVLGRGGMGVVVRASHVELGGEFALKFLTNAGASDRIHAERLLREARSCARLRSEHAVRIFDVGALPSGAPYIVMELLSGEDLNRISKRRGPLPTPEAVTYVLQAAHAIAEAHKLGIVHRDLKPANLFVTSRSDGAPLLKVLDFGIAKQVHGADEALTTTGDILGSPVYMSPEQIRDPRGVDARSDIWALGAILHRLLAGKPPFEADTSSGTLARIVSDPTPSLLAERPDVSPALAAVVARCLEKQVDRRFQTVDELVAALSAAVAAAPNTSQVSLSQATPARGGPLGAPGASSLPSPVLAEVTQATSSITSRTVPTRGRVARAVLVGAAIGVSSLVGLGVAFRASSALDVGASLGSAVAPTRPVPEAPLVPSLGNPPGTAVTPPAAEASASAASATASAAPSLAAVAGSAPPIARAGARPLPAAPRAGDGRDAARAAPPVNATAAPTPHHRSLD